MGTVYLARDTTLHRVVAVKTIKPEIVLHPELRALFVREAQLAARLEHPGVVPIYEFHDGPDTPFLVMRYIAGDSLAQWIHREGMLSIALTLHLLIELADVLGYAHGEGVVHRDLKPDNIFLEGNPVRPRPVLTDFGIAHRPFQDQGPGERRVASGTPLYMSPEQATGELDVDRRSDLFSMGVIAYQMLSGVLPFDGPTDAAVAAARVLGGRPPLARLVPEAPSALIAAIDRCLELDPKDRWATAADLGSALRLIDPASTRPPLLRRLRGMFTPSSQPPRRLAGSSVGVVTAISRR